MDLTSESAKGSRKRKKGSRAYFCIFVFVFFAAFRIGLFEKFLSQDTPVNYKKLLDIIDKHRIRKGSIRNSGTRELPKYQKGNITFKFFVPKVEGEERKPPLAVLFTTLVHFDESDKLKILAQENTIMSYKNLLPSVKTIVFTKDEFWVKRIREISSDIVVVKDFRANPYKTPILKYMFEVAFQKIEAPFYAYANGDILLANGFLNTLLAVRAAVLAKKIKPKIFLVGQRFNYNIAHYKHSFSVDKASYEKIISNWTASSRMFQTNALDYFVVTKNAFDWALMPPYVIGRPAYDNCLAKSALVQEDVETIDATWTVSALHQTGSDGNKAGMRKTGVSDYNWNYYHCKHGYDVGTTQHMKYHTESRGKEIRLLSRTLYKPFSKRNKSSQTKRLYSGAYALRIVLVLLAMMVASVACFVLLIQASDTFTQEDEIVVELNDILHVFEAQKKLVEKRCAEFNKSRKNVAKRQEEEMQRRAQFHWGYESD